MAKSLNLSPQRSIFPEIKDWQAIVLITLCVAVFFRDILLQQSYFWEDFLYYFYPVRSFAAVSIASAQLPLWNPYTFCGMPFQADIQTALFYPPNLLLTLFAGAGTLNFYWLELLIIAHYVIAGVCMYYLARSFGLKGLIGVFCGLVYCLSGFMITHAIHQVVICQVAWFPCIVLLFRKALLQRSLVHAILSGGTLGMAILAGYPQLSLYIVFFLFILFIFEFTVAITQRGWKSEWMMALLAAIVILVALALSAVQLLPTLELAGLSQRAEITYEKSLQGVLNWSQLITFLVPKYFGESGALTHNYWLPGEYWIYWETCLYLGIAAIVSAAFAAPMIRSNKYIALFFGVILFVILYAVGDKFILHKFFYDHVPGFSKFRNPARMGILLTLSASLLGGFGLQHFLAVIAKAKKNIWRVLIPASGAGVLAWLLAQGGAFQPTENQSAYMQVHPLVVAEATRALILVAAVCGILFATMRGSLSPKIFLVALIAVQFIDMNLFGFSQNNSSLNPAEYFARPASLVNLLHEEGKQEYFRINARSGGAMILDRNQGMVDRVFMLEGYTPLALQRSIPPSHSLDAVCDLLNVKYRIVVDEERRTMSLGTVPRYLPRAYMVYDVKVLKDEAEVKSFMESEAFDPDRTVVFEKEAPMTISDTSRSSGWKATISSYELNEIAIDVTSPKDGYLVLSEVYYPGWVATVDGVRQEILRANWSLRTVPIKAGNHRVQVSFEPRTFRNGLWITLTAIGLSILGVVYSLKRTPSVAAAP